MNASALGNASTVRRESRSILTLSTLGSSRMVFLIRSSFPPARGDVGCASCASDGVRELGGSKLVELCDRGVGRARAGTVVRDGVGDRDLAEEGDTADLL